MLKPELGYFLVKRGKSFFSQRSGHGAPPDGHLRFIFLCAEMAQNGLHIKDVRVAYTEFYDAVKEAGMVHKIPAYYGWNSGAFLNAREVLKLKEEYAL
jgi:hypothetical protein